MGATNMDQKDFTKLLGEVGDKWSLQVVRQLAEAGEMRFSAIKRAVPGISQRMLTLTLRSMERSGLVTRTVTPSVPQRVDYELTHAGRRLALSSSQLILWARDFLPFVRKAQASARASAA
jgi:DNA-binding HxlR family transcriptional regulator